jgi:hypothetical protein
MRRFGEVAESPINAYMADMTETPEQRKARLAQQAIDGAKAAVEYRKKTEATLRRTAQLRAERMAREAAQDDGATAKG